MQLAVNQPEQMPPAKKTPVAFSMLTKIGGAECGFGLVALTLYSMGAVEGEPHRAAAAVYILAVMVGLLALLVGSAIITARTPDRNGTRTNRLRHGGLGLLVGVALGSALALPEALLYLPAFLVATTVAVGLAVRAAKS